MAGIQLPKRLTLGPFTVRVKRKNLEKLSGNYGAYDPSQQLIHLEKTLAPELLAETLLHESLHGCWAQTSLTKRYEEEQEEEIIRALSPRLLALLRDNPLLVAYMLTAGG